MPEAHFLGRETPENPRAQVLADEAEALVDAGFPARGFASARYGDRCTVSPPGTSLDALRPDDFTEVVEYDPHGDRLLLLGRQEPDPMAALHSLVYRARDEVGAVFQVEVEPDHPVHGHLPRAEAGGSTLDRALSILDALKGSNVATLADRWVVAVGESPEAARRALEDVLDDVAAPNHELGDESEAGESEAGEPDSERQAGEPEAEPDAGEPEAEPGSGGSDAGPSAGEPEAGPP